MFISWHSMSLTHSQDQMSEGWIDLQCLWQWWCSWITNLVPHRMNETMIMEPNIQKETNTKLSIITPINTIHILFPCLKHFENSHRQFITQFSFIHFETVLLTHNHPYSLKEGRNEGKLNNMDDYLKYKSHNSHVIMNMHEKPSFKSSFKSNLLKFIDGGWNNSLKLPSPFQQSSF